MIARLKSIRQKRADFRKRLRSGKLQRFPGAFSPLVSMMIEEAGFDGVYISGATLANDLGLPDIGLTTLTEVAQRGRAIAKVTNLPAIIDLDTGFGEPMNAARAVQEVEERGLCGCHLEDQIQPKRCGHLGRKTLVDRATMIQRIKAAVAGRRDSDFAIIARTDARAVEGIDRAIQRARAYLDAGADMIFPEALENEAEFAKFRKAVKAPLLVNMTEFGRSPLLNIKQLENLGYDLVIYPVTGFRLAMKAVEDGLIALRDEGTQSPLLARMQTRQRLYEILRYEAYNRFDQSLFKPTDLTRP